MRPKLRKTSKPHLKLNRAVRTNHVDDVRDLYGSLTAEQQAYYDRFFQEANGESLDGLSPDEQREMWNKSQAARRDLMNVGTRVDSWDFERSSGFETEPAPMPRIKAQATAKQQPAQARPKAPAAPPKIAAGTTETLEQFKARGGAVAKYDPAGNLVKLEKTAQPEAKKSFKPCPRKRRGGGRRHLKVVPATPATLSYDEFLTLWRLPHGCFDIVWDEDCLHLSEEHFYDQWIERGMSPLDLLKPEFLPRGGVA